MVLVLVSFLCGGVVGAERERHEKPAGLRTMVLICMGSTIFTLASMSRALGGLEPARIAAQIVTGVGFLGAGSILRERYGGITGLTTAATIWSTAAVGIVVGAGYAAAGLALSLAILVTLGAVRRIETLLGGPCHLRRMLVIYRGNGGKTRVRIQRAIDETHGPPAALGREEHRPDGTQALPLSYCTAHREHRALLAAVSEIPSVEAFQQLEEDGDEAAKA